MRLILLPDAPGGGCGGAKLVRRDLERLGVREDDVVAVRSSNAVRDPRFHRINPPSRVSVKRIVNLARRRVSFEATARELRAYANREYDSVFCGGAELYRATRSIFPDQQLTVRLHNSFALVRSRHRELRYPVDSAFLVNLLTYPGLERTIFEDLRTRLIFATDADQAYFRLHYPHRSGQVWGVEPSIKAVVATPTLPHLVHFGGVAVHKRAGLRYFVSQVFRSIHATHPAIQLHLHGAGTERFDDPDRAVFGHGVFSESGIPQGGDGLFVNPDLLGGGIKIKIGDWLEWGVPFISTAFGVDGYEFDRTSDRIVAPIEEWGELIPDYFRNLGLI